MKRILLIICLILMSVGCSTEKLAGEYVSSKLYVNDVESGLPDFLVSFHKDEGKVYLPVTTVLYLFGGKSVGGVYRPPYENYERIQIHDKIIHYDILHATLLLETEESSEKTVLLSREDGPSNVTWYNPMLLVDHTTLKNILDAAGIPVEIRIDWENERIYIETQGGETRSTQEDGSYVFD